VFAVIPSTSLRTGFRRLRPTQPGASSPRRARWHQPFLVTLDVVRRFFLTRTDIPCTTGILRDKAAREASGCASCENHLETVADCGFGIPDCGLHRWRSQSYKDELKRRTRQFALDVIRLVELLPRSRTTEVLGKQLLRSGTSVGANYRAACRAKSSADFVSKMGIVEEEADEAIYWMELLVDSSCVRAAGVHALLQEADELLAITVSSIKTARITRYRNR